jgi:hypothetical protein
LVVRSARQASFLALPALERHSLDGLRDVVPPAMMPVQQAVRPPVRGKQPARSRA